MLVTEQLRLSHKINTVTMRYNNVAHRLRKLEGGRILQSCVPQEGDRYMIESSKFNLIIGNPSAPYLSATAVFVVNANGGNIFDLHNVAGVFVDNGMDKVGSRLMTGCRPEGGYLFRVVTPYPQVLWLDFVVELDEK